MPDCNSSARCRRRRANASGKGGQFLISLKTDQKEEVIGNANRFLQQHNQHFLADSVRLYLADYIYGLGDYKEAYHLYEDLLLEDIKGATRVHVMKQLALLKFY